MSLNDLWGVFLSNFQQTTLWEFVAVIFGLLSVWFAKKENIAVYSTGIISVLIYVKICFGARLYADMFINIIYFVMSVYGWYKWTRKGTDAKMLPISKVSFKGNIIYGLITLAFFGLLSIVLTKFTDSDVPILDSFTTSIFIVGMWLMARKKVENWIYWIIADLISVPLYFYKGLVFSSFQFFVFLIIAVLGYIAWRKKLNSESVKSLSL